MNQSLKEFGIHRRRQCFNVTITNDRTAEESETFTVILEKPSNKSFPQVRIHPGIVTITISDDDKRKCIVFWMYVDQEHLIVINCHHAIYPSGVPNQVERLIFSLGLGSGGYDYSPINEPAPPAPVSPAPVSPAPVSPAPVSPAPTSPSNTTRSEEPRCPANGKNGEICSDPPRGLLIFHISYLCIVGNFHLNTSIMVDALSVV